MTSGEPDAASAAPPDAAACYLYGVVPSQTPLPPDLLGVGSPPGPLRLITHRGIAAVASAVPTGAVLGTAADMRAHAQVVNSLAAATAVLPMRFGGLMADEESVVAELLAPRHDEFVGQLGQLAGLAQFTVRARYVGDVALREALLADPEAMRLREALRGHHADVWRPESIRLGELVTRAMECNRESDLRALIDTLTPHAAAVTEHVPSACDAPASASFLVADSQRTRFEAAAEQLGQRWQGRIRLRLLGPVAPYDFTELSPAGG